MLGLGNKRNFFLSAALLFMLNIADAVWTLYYSKFAGFEETNPQMEVALNISPELFATVKFVQVTLGIFVLCVTQRKPLSQVGLILVAIFFAVVVGGHIGTYLNNYWPVF